jgi:hypothetical protein
MPLAATSGFRILSSKYTTYGAIDKLQVKQQKMKNYCLLVAICVYRIIQALTLSLF